MNTYKSKKRMLSPIDEIKKKRREGVKIRYSIRWINGRCFLCFNYEEST